MSEERNERNEMILIVMNFIPQNNIPELPRRLFYVAMTRAKENVILITDKFYKSKFIHELEASGQLSATKKCPRCKTADLRLRTGTKNGKAWSFYGCSNYIYGCDYVEWVNNNAT